MSAKTILLICAVSFQALFFGGLASAQGVANKVLNGDQNTRWVLGSAYEGRFPYGWSENSPRGVQVCRTYAPPSNSVGTLSVDELYKACAVQVYSVAGTNKLITDLNEEVLKKLDKVPDQVKASIKEQVEEDILNELRKEIAAGRLHSQNTDPESGMLQAYSTNMARFGIVGIGLTFIVGSAVGAFVFRRK